MTSTVGSTSSRRRGAVLLVVSMGWLAVARGLGDLLVGALPPAVVRQLGRHGYYSVVLVLTTALGLAAVCATHRASWRAALGLASGQARGAAVGVLIAPTVIALATYLGFTLALPTLLEELQRGGFAEANRNTGGYGRALVESALPLTLLWGLVLAPIAEELLFRGAMWTALTRLTAPRGVPSPPSLDPSFVSDTWLRRGARWVYAEARDGGVATLITAAVFAALHADQPGGAGIVRVVQAAGLGLALGIARHASGGVAAPIALHATFNLLSLARLRRWLPSTFWPPPLPVPVTYWQLAGAGLAILSVATVARRVRERGRTRRPTP
ncbi:MAG: CPBP family intramembrane glutamic endopeptidase [Myxococcota bacterium]